MHDIFIHTKNIIHRDIKQDNFTIGMDNKSHINMF